MGLFGRRSTTIHFTQAAAPLHNPGKGLVGWAEHGEAVTQPVRLVYAPVYWRDIEPQPGCYDFEGFHKRMRFDYWRERGAQFILRPIADYPGEHEHADIPPWLLEQTGADGMYYRTSLGRGYSPNYENNTLIERHALLLAALGRQYDRDPAVAYIQLGSLGHYGEWHVTSPEGLPEFPRSHVTDIYVGHYLEAFPHKRMMMRRGFPIAKERGLGLYNDMLGNRQATEEFLDAIEHGYLSSQSREQFPAMPDFWKYAPSGGELSSDIPLTNHIGLLYDNLKGQVLRSHTTCIGPCSPAALPLGCPQQPHIDDLVRTLGYTFTAQRAGVTLRRDRCDVRFTFHNTGVAPLYLERQLTYLWLSADGRPLSATPSPLALSTVTAQVTDTITLPAPPEGATLAVGILDMSTNAPDVGFANEEMQNGYLIFGDVRRFGGNA